MSGAAVYERLVELTSTARFLNRVVKRSLQAGLRSPMRDLLIRGMAYLCRLQIKKLQHPMAPSANTPRLLLLSPERFTRDINELADTNKFQIFLAPPAWQFRLFSLFYDRVDKETETAVVRHLSHLRLEDYERRFLGFAMAHHLDEPVLIRAQDDFRTFLAEFLSHLYRSLRIDCVAGVNFWYRQDVHWGVVSKQLGVPYIVFFKEGFRTEAGDQQHIIDRCKLLGGKFEGTYLAAPNPEVWGVFRRAGYVDETNSGSVGAPRMDALAKELSGGTPPIPDNGRPMVTLFSFNPGIGLIDLGIKAWPDNPDAGWGKLFRATHAAFAKIAVSCPKADFVIKAKWGGSWIDKIREAIRSGGVDSEDIANLRIVADEDPLGLIRKSRVVCAFNSTTMLEAAVMGRPVIVPEFREEIAHDLRGYVKFSGRGDIFDIVNSFEEMKDCVQQRLTDYQIPEQIMAMRRTEFEKWISNLDGTATENWCRVIESAIGNSLTHEHSRAASSSPALSSAVE